MNNEIIYRYFPNLSDLQKDRIDKLDDLYRYWNSQINVISRKDIDNIYLHHVLHSLSIMKFYTFNEGSSIMDLGCGGGFPGIPLAIINENCRFTLIDGKAKKIKVVNEIASELGLKNVFGIHQRAEECNSNFDFVVTRAVATIDKLKSWSYPVLKKKNKGPMPPGLFAYKGGNINEELKFLDKNDYYELNDIHEAIPENYFKEKYIIYLQR
ncbi:MAG TPA: 16S rRNA (guanine(527)-N(7))-methyltransferase RsmG [Arcobacter sp.]|nr:16S rRNA (guanine(527)-N(7))-methyltransferase RsmG [Arcobacter sp.]